MNIYDIKKYIFEIITELNPEVSELDLEKNYSLIDDLGFDSLMLINFIVRIETKFNFSFKIDDDINLLADNLDKLAEYIYNVER
ncbi:MAG: acyl carrier protein [Acutalibacteraceae bacterium]|nr:acyl carrier protein [Acutalibacteraceae bacterium]